tara:strand:+ start:165 stop:1160 length:996 start_codon:yes stop_codon:yes gene_type:complete
MILKSFEFNKINTDNYNFYLFYGENDGLKKEIISNNFEKAFDKKIYKYEENFILQNEKMFFDEILTSSFFEDKKLIIISESTNKLINIIDDLIQRDLKDIFIILIADKLEKKSRLRSKFEKEKDLVCVPFYSDNYQSLLYLTNEFFKKLKISVSQQILNTIVNRANGDRQSLKNEMIKIENYLKNKKKIDLSEIIKLTNLSENNNFSELVDICLAKNKKRLMDIINENNFSNEDTIIIIRTFLNKTKRLIKINNEVSKTKNLDKVLTTFKPPIFWKDKELVRQQIKNYSKENLEVLIDSINKTELLIKKNYNNAINILLDFMLNREEKINN